MTLQTIQPHVATRWRDRADSLARWLAVVLLLLLLLHAHGWAQGQSGVNTYDASGNLLVNCATGCSGGGGGSVTQGTVPWQVSPNSSANSITNPFLDLLTDGTHQMGAMTTYGTAPSGYALPVNAFVTNFPSTQNVNVTNSSLAVTGTFWQTTQPVSGTVTANQGGAPWSVSQSGTWNVGLNAGSNAIGSITNTGFNVNNFPATQAVTQSGTWTVQQGGAPWSVSQSGSWTVGVNNFPSSFSVSNLPSLQQIAGSVSVTNLPIDPLSNTVKIEPVIGGAPYDARQIRPLTTADSVSVANFPATQTVTGSVAITSVPAHAVNVTNLPTDSISGALKQEVIVGGQSIDPRQIRALTSADLVTIANLPATQPVSGSVSVSNLPAVQPVTVNNLPVDPLAKVVETEPVIGGTPYDSRQIRALTANDTVTVANPAVSVTNLPTNQTVTVSNWPTTLNGNIATKFNPVPVANQSPILLYALVNGTLVPVILTEGQNVMAQSLPVVIASNQTAVPVANAPSAPDYGNGPNGAQQIAVDNTGNVGVRLVGAARLGGLPLPPCNAVLQTNCQHF